MAQIRRATPSDVGAIVDAILTSLAVDSSWKSLFPTGFRKNPAYDQYAREILKRYLAPGNHDWQVLVAVPPKDDSPKDDSPAIVSVAIWDISHSRYHNAWRKSTSTLCDLGDVIPVMSPDNNDSVVDNLTALSAAISFSQKQHFEHLEPYVYLEVLATHPAHRGQGYAKALCAVGVDSARKRNLAIAVLTSSRGYIFFSGLAFGDLGCVSLRGSDGSREDCVLKAMILHPELKRRRSSVVDTFLKDVSLGTSPK